tara:strand:+ start:4101 stop:4823 length:723 start_codon:yes stop_codon:yes gene_type:complete
MTYRKRLVFLLVAALASFSPFAGAADMSLTPHTAAYKVKVKILSGELNTTLEQAETGFVATHKLNTTGMARLLAKGEIEETASFMVSADGVMPLLYSSQDSMTSKKTHADVRFDIAHGEVVGSVDGEAFNMPFADLVHDRVSIQYQLMLDLQRGMLQDVYVLYDIDELKTLQVTNIGQQSVKTPAGTFEAVGIQHQTEGSSRVTTLWCVPELGYIPAIIEQHRKGKLRMRALLESYTPTL